MDPSKPEGNTSDADTGGQGAGSRSGWNDAGTGGSGGGSGSGPSGGGSPEAHDHSPEEGDIQESLLGEIELLRRELAEANGRYQRALADYHNYHRRALQNEIVAKQQGAGGVVKSVVGVIDHFDVALAQDLAKVDAQQIVAGVRLIRDELLKALQSHGVRLLAPGANDEFEPGKHEAVTQMTADGVEAGRIVATFQAGYQLGDHVLRPAKVAVAPRE
ncbi:MAG: nucleotide exchange factor GrpE [Planctomycetota bacterium]|nr:nucleotide exchange factor GrpE [Planctomycetota bacterium]